MAAGGSSASAQSAAIRRDAPVRRPRGIGAMPDLLDDGARAAAMRDFQADILAPSNRHSVESRVRTCTRMLDFWGLPMLPPSAPGISALGASLKAGGYRSAAVYLGVYKSWVSRQGALWDSACQQAMADAIRSCERGLGGPVKARALPFGKLDRLPLSTQPWVAGGPMRPRNSIVMGAWFLTREIELSTAVAGSLELSLDAAGRPRVRFHLPASKSDMKATGTAREHGCSCSGRVSASCPAHAAWDQWSFLRREFPDRWQGDRPDGDLPLFPCHRGTACAKEAMTSHIQHAAALLGVELAAPDGSERVTGHSLRATGAQGLASAGVDTWAIELLGRWGSDVVRSYIREARLHDAANMAHRVSASTTHLDELVAGIVHRVLAGGAGATSSSSSTSLALASEACSGLLLEPSAALSLAAPLADSVQIAEAEAAPRPTTDFVLNRATGTAHRAVVGPHTGVAASWVAACGWKYGLTILAQPIGEADLPGDFRLLCKRCLPTWRARRQQALAVAAAP